MRYLSLLYPLLFLTTPVSKNNQWRVTMHLFCTADERTLLRYHDKQIEVFGLHPLARRFICTGRIVALSVDSTMMLVQACNSYMIYNLNSGVSEPLHNVDTSAFAASQRLDAVNRSRDYNVHNLFRGESIMKLYIPKEEGASRGFTDAMPYRVLGTAYGCLYGWYDTTWGEGEELHLYALDDGKYIMQLAVGIPYYEPVQQILLILQWTGNVEIVDISELKILGQLSLADFINKITNNNTYRQFEGAIASHSHNFQQVALSIGREVYLIDIQIPTEMLEYPYPQQRQYTYSVQDKLNGRHTINALYFLPDGQHLCASYRHGGLNIFDIKRKRLTEQFVPSLYEYLSKFFGWTK